MWEALDLIPRLSIPLLAQERVCVCENQSSVSKAVCVSVSAISKHVRWSIPLLTRECVSVSVRLCVCVWVYHRSMSNKAGDTEKHISIGHIFRVVSPTTVLAQDHFYSDTSAYTPVIRTPIIHWWCSLRFHDAKNMLHKLDEGSMERWTEVDTPFSANRDWPHGSF